MQINTDRHTLAQQRYAEHRPHAADLRVVLGRIVRIRQGIEDMHRAAGKHRPANQGVGARLDACLLFDRKVSGIETTVHRQSIGPVFERERS